MKHTTRENGKESSWIEDFHATRAHPPKLVVIGKCLFCQCDATQKQCQLKSPTTRTEYIMICGASECFNKAMAHTFTQTFPR